MRDAVHKLFYKYRLGLLVVFACIISFSQGYADNHVKTIKSVVSDFKTNPLLNAIVNQTTPSLINLSESRARSILQKRGLKLKVVSRRQLPTGRNLIISQRPKAGTRISLGKTVSVDISVPLASKPKPLTVSISPRSLTVEQGTPAVFNVIYNKKNVRFKWQMNGQSGTGANFRVNTKTLKAGSYVVSLDVTEFYQIKLSTHTQNASRIKRASARLIVITKVAQKIVPNVIKYSRNQALQILRNNRLNLGKVTEKPTTTKTLNDIIFNQRPSAGQKTGVGEKVDIWVHKLKLEPLRISITPRQHVIEQGETVTFMANSKTESLTYNWSGAGQNSSSTRFVINSNKLPPNTYSITLKVWDRNKRSAIDRAVLEVNKKIPERIPVPDVTENYRSNAIKLLQSKRLRLGKTTFETRSTGRNDWVLKQQPVPGTKVLPNSKIDLVVSKHPPLPSLEVRIDPLNPVIEQGKEVSFDVVTKNELTSYRWEGAGQNRRSKRFTMQSQNLPVKSYEIKLTVGDKHRRKVTALTTLRVIKPKEDPISVVPNVNSFKLEDAIRRLKSKKLNAGNIIYREITSADDGRVLGQSPKAGDKVKLGSKVDLWVSKKKTLVVVPDLIGQEFESAREVLAANSLFSGSIREKVISTGEAGRILEQSPKAGVEVKPDSKVDLWISKKEILIVVPDLVGQEFETAREVLAAKSLLSGSIREKVVSSGESGRVIEQSPKAGTEVKPDSKVDLWISKKETLIVVPDLIGQEFESAREVLTAKGLNSGSIREKIVSSGEAGRVLEQSPKAGVEVKPDSKINLLISKKEILIVVPDLVGQELESAREVLTSKGLNSGSIREKIVSSGESGRVLEQSPKAMTQVKKGSEVNLIISSVSILPFTLELNVENSRHLAGKATRFFLKTSNPDPDADYWLQLNDSQSSGKFSQTSYEHIFKHNGLHSVYAKTRVNGVDYQSAPVSILILPTWLIPLAAGLGLLSLGVGVAKTANPPQVKVVKKLKPSRISVKPNTDSGYQEISRVSLVEGKKSNIDGQGYHISAGFDNALKDGEFEVLIEETQKKIKGSYSDE